MKRTCLWKYLEESPGVRTEELLYLRVLREDLTAPRSVRLICIRPKKVSSHHSLLFCLSLSPSSHLSFSKRDPLFLSFPLFLRFSLSLWYKYVCSSSFPGYLINLMGWFVCYWNKLWVGLGWVDNLKEWYRILGLCLKLAKGGGCD